MRGWPSVDSCFKRGGKSLVHSGRLCLRQRLETSLQRHATVVCAFVFARLFVCGRAHTICRRRGPGYRRARRGVAGVAGPADTGRGAATAAPHDAPPYARRPRPGETASHSSVPALCSRLHQPRRHAPPPLLRISLSFPPPQPSNHQRQRAPLPPKDGPAWPLAFSDARTCSRQSLGTPLVVLTARLARRSRARRRRVDSLTRKKGGRLSSPPPPRARSPSKYPGARGGRVCAQSVNARHRPAHSSRSPRPRPGGARARARASRAPPRK
jgi:hypothetical protein